jgi:hypothetical protein
MTQLLVTQKEKLLAHLFAANWIVHAWYSRVEFVDRVPREVLLYS